MGYSLKPEHKSETWRKVYLIRVVQVLVSLVGVVSVEESCMSHLLEFSQCSGG